MDEPLPEEVVVPEEPSEYVFEEHGTTRASLGPRYAPEITDEEFSEAYARGFAKQQAVKGTGRRVSALQMAHARGLWQKQALDMPGGGVPVWKAKHAAEQKKGKHNQTELKSSWD